MTDKPGYRRVVYATLRGYRETTDPENVEALCSHCDEFKGPQKWCSDSCGPTNVWVDDVTFVKMRLEGFV
jgi:hypothetical protein